MTAVLTGMLEDIKLINRDVAAELVALGVGADALLPDESQDCDPITAAEVTLRCERARRHSAKLLRIARDVRSQSLARIAADAESLERANAEADAAAEAAATLAAEQELEQLRAELVRLESEMASDETS